MNSFSNGHVAWMGLIIAVVVILSRSFSIVFPSSQLPTAAVIGDGRFWPRVEQPREWQTPAMLEWHLDANLSADQVLKMREDELAEIILKT